MQKYLIILTAPTLHFMFDPDDYFEPYVVNTIPESLNYWIEKAERHFCKKHNVPLASIQLLHMYKVK